MKTRLISIILVAVLLLGSAAVLASCDGNQTETDAPTDKVTETPSEKPTETSTEEPTAAPTDEATVAPTEEPTVAPTEEPTAAPTEEPTAAPTEEPTAAPTEEPTVVPTEEPTAEPTEEPTAEPTEEPTVAPTEEPTEEPTEVPEPGCPDGTCEFKSVRGKPTCKVCGYIAACQGIHDYTSNLEGHWKPECPHCGKEAGEPLNHEYEEKVIDEGDLLVYSFRCTICKYRAYEQEVPYEINAFYSAGDLSYTDTSGALTGKFGFEAGVGYASYSSEKGGSATVVVASNGEIGDSSGRYLVMKVRLPKSQSQFTASVKSVGVYGAQTMIFSSLRSTWTTIIVDLTKTATVKPVKDSSTGITKDEKHGYHDIGGEYFLGDLRLSVTAGEGESFDVAYVMMCETLEDAKAFTEGEKNIVTYNDILNEQPDVESGKCYDENGNEIIHKYIINDDGTHSLKESCHQCGLAAVENEPHSYAQTIDENGEYTYACGACGHSKYGATINKYISSAEIDRIGHSYYKINKLGITEDEGGFDYASFSGQSTTAQIIFARTGFNDAEAASAFPVGDASLFIIRMRTNDPKVSFGIQFGTPEAPVTNFRFPTAVAADGWATYVVDLAALMPTSYVADANGEYTVQNFYFHIGGADFTSEVIYDVDFMAFVDQWSEIGVLTPDENVINVTAANVGGWVTTADKQCVGGAHTASVVVEDGKYVVVCGSCGYKIREYAVPSDIERFMPAETLAGITAAAGGIDVTQMIEGEGENEVSFVRLDNMQINNDREAWMGWNVMSTSKAPISGQYMIMKFRLPKDQLGQTFLDMYTATKQTLAAGMRVTINTSEDNEWHTVVIDLSKCVPDPATYFVADEDGYHVRYLQMRVFSGHQAKAMLDENGNQVKKTYVNSNGETKEYNAQETKPTPEMYMDIAYIAYCDNIGDVTEIVDTETYEFYEASGTASIRNGEDGSCFTHSYSDVVDGETHKIVCSGCGDVAKTFTVSTDINFYADLGKMDHYNSTLSKGVFDEDEKIVFNRYEGSANAHLNLTGGGGAGTWTADTYQTGKYIAIKYRTGGGVFALYISTKNNGNSIEFPTNTTRPEYSAVATKTVPTCDGKWTVALIEITSDMTYYTTDSEQEIAIMISASGTYALDIAYVAVVDSEDEAKTLLSEGETFENGWGLSSGGSSGEEGGEEGGTTPTPPPASEHEITETVADGENGAKVYIYNCPHCEMDIVKNLPASVSGYFSAATLANKAPSYHQLGSHKIDADDTVFARFIGSDKISQALWLRVQADCDKNTSTGVFKDVPSVDLGQAKYMIIRARTNATSHPFIVNISTTGKNSPTAISVDGSEGQYNINGEALKAGDTYATGTGYVGINIPLKATEADEWGVYVVDLATVIPEYYVKDSETDTYILDTFYFHFNSFASTTALDVDYIGFVENWDDIRTMYGDELAIVKISDTSGAYGMVSSKDQSCIKHNGVVSVDDNGNYVVTCSMCGEKMADYGIKAEALGGFLSAEALTSTGTAYGSFDREYSVEDGVSFVRISNSKMGIDNWTGFTIVNSNKNAYVGQYMVIRFRIGQNGLGQSKLEFYASTKQGALEGASYVAIKASEDAQWHTVVVDLSQRISNPSTNFVAEDGAYYLRYLQMRPFSGNQGGAQEDDYMDISYIGFCDSLDDLKDIVGDSYELSVSASENVVTSTASE